MTPVKRTLAPLAALLLLTSCAGGAEPEPSPTVTETVTATPEPAPTVTETVTATPEPEETEAPDAAEADRTDEVREIAGNDVTEAVENSPGEFVISTSLVDPRGDAGSPEAQSALAICEAVQEEFEASNVRVEESDGSTLVVLGGAWAECTEV